MKLWSPHERGSRLAAVACGALLAVAMLGFSAVQAGAAGYGDGAPIPFLLFPADNPVNMPVDTLPLDPNSADYIAHMAPATGLHPDFGTRWEGSAIGIPYAVVPGDQPKVPIHFTEYADESDPGPYPIPPDAPVEGAGGPFNDGDRHVLVLDADHKMLYELYHASRQPDGSWNAGSGAVFDLASNALRPAGWTSADAAGMAILPSLVRYDEVVGEGVLDHAVRFTVAETQRAYVYPANHFASDDTDSDLPPMGLRVRLKAEFDISAFPPIVQTILRGLKKYGMMVADNGSDWYVGGAPDPRWDDEALHSLNRVKGSDFEVVDSRALLPSPAPSPFTVSMPAAEQVAEGSGWSAGGSFSDAGGSIWNAVVDYGDGDQLLAVQPDDSFGLAHTWTDDGVQRVRVTVTSDQARTASGTSVVTVLNVVPIVQAGVNATVRPGVLFTRTASFTDPGADTWHGWVQYGDDSAPQPLRLRADKSFRLAHRYPRAKGRGYVVVVTVADDDGGLGVARFRVTVR